MSRWRVRARSVPKRGESTNHNKDRFSIATPRSGRLLLAVADGATQAYRAEIWAEMLVDAWTRQRLSVSRSNEATARTIDQLAGSWLNVAEPSADAPWYVTAKASRGAFATLLGVELRLDRRTWRWRALAIGDTSLFVLDGHSGLETAYPMWRSRDFTSTPPLIGAGGANPDLDRGRRIRAAGGLVHGGRLIAATDAMAKCLLAAHEDGTPLWADAVDATSTKLGFARWVDELRQAGRLEDDDTTLLLAERIR